MAPNDPVNDRLRAAGDAIAVDDDFAALNAVQDGVAKRRKRRRAIAGLGAGALLVAGGVVAVNQLGDGESDSLSIAGVDEPAPTTSVAAESATGAESSDEPVDDSSVQGDVETTAPATAAPVSTLPPIQMAGQMIDASATVTPVASDLRDAQLNWLVPWQDGFLASRTLIVPQALPTELPEDIAALFPQEVLDLFADGLPPTINEATQVLSEAGLLDEVTTVLSEHPEASEAIYSQPSVSPGLDVSFSADGIDWQPVDFVMPDGASYVLSVQSTGDRIVALVDITDPLGAVNSRVQAVATTTDLVEWEVTELPFPEVTSDQPAGVFTSTYAELLAVNGSGWLATVSQQVEIDIDALVPLFPDDVAARYAASEGRVGYGTGPDGIALFFNEDPGGGDSETDVVDVSWAELGVDVEFGQALDTQRQSTVAATWDSDPVVSDVETPVYNVVSTDAGFFSSQGRIMYSANGVSWQELAVPDDVLLVESLMSVESGVLVFGYGREGDFLVRRIVEPTEPWEVVGVPEAFSRPPGQGYSTGTSSVNIVETSERPQEQTRKVVLEGEGYTLTMEQGYPVSSLYLTDESGAVVLDDPAVVLFAAQGDNSIEPALFDERGLTIIDVETGDEIVTFSNDLLAAANDDGSDDDSAEAVEWNPDFWVLATLEGERWLFEDLPDPDPGQGYFGPSQAAVNGSTLVVYLGAEWQVFDLS